MQAPSLQKIIQAKNNFSDKILSKFGQSDFFYTSTKAVSPKNLSSEPFRYSNILMQTIQKKTKKKRLKSIESQKLS